MIIIGIDEVGRGCWAGPLVAGAVAYHASAATPAGLDDSKKLSRARRQDLDTQVRGSALATGLGWVSPGAIDSGGITEAVKCAMAEALALAMAKIPIDEQVDVVIDGSYNFLHQFAAADWPQRVSIRTLIGADGIVPAASAASIIAKFARDAYMSGEAHLQYPAYGFDKHVGYGTAAHIAALTEHGVTDLHRQSFKPVGKFLQERGPMLQSAT